MDVAYLCRLFQRYDHQSPYQLLLRLKMNFAAEWLQQPGALVKQVAERAGFTDPFHFSREFKSVFGVAPDGKAVVYMTSPTVLSAIDQPKPRAWSVRPTKSCRSM